LDLIIFSTIRLQNYPIAPSAEHPLEKMCWKIAAVLAIIPLVCFLLHVVAFMTKGRDKAPPGLAN